MADLARQLELEGINALPHKTAFPTTRYQGSKRRLMEWIWHSVKHLSFDSVLDAFGGSGAVAYQFKLAGKQVVYNDILGFNHMIGLALVENSHVTLNDDTVDQLLLADADRDRSDFITRTFDGIYFTREENAWLDCVRQNIDRTLTDPYMRALALFALYQACMVKRPYNLFHRKNLYIREAQVRRTFGNKTTWDTPFEEHFRKFVRQANHAVFDNGRDNRALNLDAAVISEKFDLVYIDPPYMSQRGVGVDYMAFYHFLEGLTRYNEWESLIDYSSKHRALLSQPTDWCSKDRIHSAFANLIEHHADSILVISYRSDGIPSREELVQMLRKHKQTVVQAALPRQYALSRNTSSRELLLIGV